jgi:phosphoribosylglycinamide formyltransferase 1
MCIILNLNFAFKCSNPLIQYKMNVKKLAIFASGSGTNAEAIIKYFRNHKKIVVDSLWSNNAAAYALIRASDAGVQTFVFTRQQFYNTGEIVQQLDSRGVDLVVLAGFLWLVPENLIEKFPVINIHPALLPKYGGKGMYGMKVHQSVVENQDLETGISIHLVNNNYDEGELVFQAKCEVLPGDTPDDVAKKVHELEYKYFPSVIEKFIEQM